jgi:hypothetical protein
MPRPNCDTQNFGMVFVVWVQVLFDLQDLPHFFEVYRQPLR